MEAVDERIQALIADMLATMYDAQGIGLAATCSIYMVAAFLSVFFVLKYVHETKGKELEQMEG